MFQNMNHIDTVRKQDNGFLKHTNQLEQNMLKIP